MKLIRVYGWTELNGTSFGRIDTIDIPKDCVFVSDKDTKEVGFTDRLVEGVWFSTFSAAKKEMIRVLKEGISWRREAISITKKLTKKDAE